MKPFVPLNDKTYIKILLADDHEMVADSLSRLIMAMDDIQVTATFYDGLQLLESYHLHDFDIIVTDLQMPRLSGIDLTLHLREHKPDVKILILTMVEDAVMIREAIRAGVNGYIFKKSNKSELEKAIRTVASGNNYFPQEVILKLAEISNENTTNGHEQLQEIGVLTKREIEIIRMIVQEMSNMDVAAQLNLSITTVETHRRNIFKKLNVNSALGLLKYAIKHNLLE
jgi:DNA-binding NarL/FixJ family response regulator